MPIRRSAAGEIRELVTRLVDGDSVSRDAASARLAVIGARATRALTGALQATPSAPAQAAILRTLEAIHDPQSVPSAARLVDAADVDVATAAVALLRRFIRHGDGALANAAFERLTSAALDPTRPGPVRVAALEALSDLPVQTTREVLRQLERDPNPELRAAATGSERTDDLPGTLADITQASLCPEPHVLRRMVEDERRRVPLTVLRRLIEFIRTREQADTASTRRTEWQAARAAVHHALAERGSRLGLYDLRESFSTVPGPLPVGFVAALERVGDASCLDEVAAAYVRARAANDAWWTEHLGSAFREIVRRERLTRRSPGVKRVLAKWSQVGEELLPRKR